ncbi:MAG: helix-turn-helix domain-containing protein [Paracoccaceae bacterium]
MDHIENSPVLADGPQPGEVPVMMADLPDPNDIGVLTPWQVDFRQLEPGALSTRIVMRGSETVTLTSLNLSHRVHQRGVPPSGWMTFGIAAHDRLASWQGRSVTPQSLLSFGAQVEFDSVSEAGFSGKVLSFRADRVERLAAQAGFDLPDLSTLTEQFRAEDELPRWRELDQLFSTALMDQTSEWSTDTEEALMLDTLAVLLGGKRHADKSSPRTRQKVSNRAIDIMRANLEDPVSISDLCQLCGASWRTLERAFKERFGLGPKAYYLRLRLSAARRALMQAAPTDKVADAAHQFGFWHMGQFAQDYRQFFGQLPSETMGERA